MKIVYDPQADTLHLWLQETTVTIKELAEGVSADYDQNGQLAGIEILDAARRLSEQDSLRWITLVGMGEVVPVWYSESNKSFYAEALTWLQQDGENWRSVGDSGDCLTPEASLALVRELYAAGAAKVWASGRYLDDAEEGGDYFEVVLPEDAEARKRLFEIQKRVMRETGSPFDPAEEAGQKSFTIGW